jgi:hypothetical protein
MEAVVMRTLERLEWGPLQHTKRMEVLPLLGPEEGPAYLTLKEALESHWLEVKEVSHGGSVPDLMAQNKGEQPILLLDGEELSGAKQNRVLNTSLLLPAKTTQLISVSCTERGRWSYVSPHFGESEYLMAAKIRAKKERAVTHSLRQQQQFHGNQGEVWNEIERLQDQACVSSPTGAMRDVYTARENDLADLLAQFPCLEGQRGLLVLLDGVVAGFDLLSRPQAYRLLHAKLVKSYAMESLYSKGKTATDPEKLAVAFLQRCRGTEERKFKSLGHGWDFRYSAPALAGSALVWEDATIHTAFFALDEEEEIGTVADLRHRRGFRASG